MYRKIYAAMLLVLISTSVIMAQMRMSPEERTKEITERLKLSEKQAKQVEGIYTKFSEKMQDLFSSSGGDRQQMRDEMMKLREESNKEIMKILNTKQKAEFKKFLDEQQARRQQQRPM